MKAAVIEAFGQPLSIQNVPDPTPGENGVVIRVGATGLCRSDWHAWMGHDTDVVLPHVPGHELAGAIECVGKNVRRWHAGERVTLPFVNGCGTCPQCLSGNAQVCDHQFQPGFTHWGSFAEYVSIDYADFNLVRLPDDLDDVTAASLGCRFVTSFRAVVEQGKVSGGQWVAVHGCGGVGLSAIMIASAVGANVVAVDIADDKLDFARSIGAVAWVNAAKMSNQEVAERVREITGGGAHVSLDALGSQVTCFNSISCLRKRGKHVQVGLMLADQRTPIIPMDRVIAHELEILGSHGIQAYKYPLLLEMIHTGKLHPERLIGHTISLEQSLDELARMNEFRGVGVTVIDRF
ncbi:MAG TPA: zinc-dependent alcohol dehydrogenase family protein [Anaerolineaceae bacterium]|jgi:alcohol dehydrogenase